MIVRRLIVLTAFLSIVHAGIAQETESTPASWSNELWREHLTSAPAASRWFVGARFGSDLSQLTGDRGYEILASCWPDIAPSVKKQVLKGFTPEFNKIPGLHDRYFDVLHLGMMDPDREVQSFAATYLGFRVFRGFTGPDAAYRAWRSTTRGEKASDIGLAECVRFVESLRTTEPESIQSVLKRLRDARRALREHDSAREILRDIIDTWISDGALDPLDTGLLGLRYSLPLYEELEPGDTRDRVRVWCDRLSELWKTQVASERVSEFGLVVNALAEADDPRAIPLFIGIIDADNSYDTIYGVGYFGLSKLTGVPYSPFHDGAWWKRWWARNEMDLDVDILSIPIPQLPKTEKGKAHVSFPEDLDTLEGKLAWMVDQLEAGSIRSAFRAAQEVATHGSPAAIPTLIAVIEADDTGEAVYRVGYFGLSGITGVEYDETHDGAWWRDWWETNSGAYPDEVRDLPIPTLSTPADKQPESADAQPEGAERSPLTDPEFIGYPAQDITADGNGSMRYFLIGPADTHEQPEEGYRLLLILPGGPGSADFHPFCRRIHKNALPKGYVVAQLVAPVWVDNEDRIVWPTRQQAPEEAEFATEDFVRAVVDDVMGRVEIDERYVFSLGWSSSGPPLYSMSLREDSPITGTFIAMSVFKPDTLPDLSAAKGHRYYLLHSPDDFISIEQHARVAEQRLRDAGATTTLTAYRGGHGWREDPFGHIMRGIKWLEFEMPNNSTEVP